MKRRFRCPLLLVACCVAGCSGPPRGAETAPNILVLLVDTLRADRLGAYGNQRGLTPFLDAIAARSYVFDQAYAQSPWTNPSVASLFTSRYPSQHHIVTFTSRLDDTETTLAAQLQARGYATGAFVANGLLGGKKGFQRGFDIFRPLWPRPVDGGSPTKAGKWRAEAVDELALAWLDELPTSPRKPVFLYLHYVEPHPPYSPPLPTVDRLAGGPAPFDLEGLNVHMLYVARWGRTDDKTRAGLELAYDAEVKSLDASLAALFAGLEERGFLDEAVVVFTADHGEEFSDHAKIGHGHTLYNELIRVPLIVQMPDQATGYRVHEPVSLIDVAPTLVELAGTSAPASWEGRSLFAPIERAKTGAAADDRSSVPATAFSELLPAEGTGTPGGHRHAIIRGSQKMIVNSEGASELYDLAQDPGEHVREDEQEAAPLRRAFAEFTDRTAGAGPSPQAPAMDPETERHLRAFGYVN